MEQELLEQEELQMKDARGWMKEIKEMLEPELKEPQRCVFASCSTHNTSGADASGELSRLVR